MGKNLKKEKSRRQLALYYRRKYYKKYSPIINKLSADIAKHEERERQMVSRDEIGYLLKMASTYRNYAVKLAKAQREKIVQMNSEIMKMSSEICLDIDNSWTRWRPLLKRFARNGFFEQKL